MHAPTAGMLAMAVRSLLLFTVALAACGDRSSHDAGDPPLPGAGDPDFGLAGNVLISDRALLGGPDAEVDTVWIGFDSVAAWAILLDLHERHGTEFWVCGRVVPDARHRSGFYFDPATTTAAENVAETLQTPLDLVKAEPTGGTCPMACCIGAGVERLAPEE